jgi:uncharacterized protein YjdB
MQKLSRSLIALGGVAALAACGDDVSIQPPAEPPASVVTQVTVSPATLNLKVGEKATLGVSVATTGPGVATTVTWASSTPAVATVSATGEVTAVAPGNTTVRATSTADASKSGAAQVTVTAPAVRSVTVSPQTLALQVGQSATAVATVDRDAGVAGTVNWASSNTAVATVSSAGVITAVAPGTAVVSATSTVDNTKSSALAVTVSPVPNNLTALSVAPTTASLGVGGTVQLVPSATTVGTPTVTYTYASSNTAVATVSNSGLVTAVGNGTAVITTTATTNTNSLSVATTINVASASVSISTITAGGLGTPVNIANVAGQIEVTMNITAGNQILDSVVVKLGSKSAASQTFTVNGAPNAPVTLSINTAAYTINADSTSTVSFLNGSTGVVAELYVKGVQGPTASNTITIVLNNADTFHMRWTLPSNQANSAAGFLWYGGPGTSTTVNAIPVMYTGNTVTSATIHLDDQTIFGNDAPCGTVTDAAGPFTGTFTCAGVTNPNIQPAVLASLRADGNAGPANTWAFFGPSSTGPRNANGQIMQQQGQIPVRIDVAGPATATYAWVAPTTNDFWANAGFRFDTSKAGVFSRARGADAGVGTAAASTDLYEFEDRAVTGTTWTSHNANTNNIPENAVDFTVNAYNGRVTEKDLLGNMTVTYLGSTGTSPGSQNFGVDISAPEIAYLTSTAGSGEPRTLLPALDTLGNTKILSNEGNVANTIRADSGYFGVRYRDTRSGFNTTAGLEPGSIRITRLAPSGATCVVGVVSGSSCLFAKRLGAVDANDNTFRRDTSGVYGSGINASGGATGDLYTPAAAADSAGYYTYEIFITDRAGNTSSTISKTVAVDVAQPLITGIGFPAILTGGAPVAFAPNATDELEVLDGALGLTYPGMAALGAGTDTLYFPRTFFTDYKAPFSGAPLSNVVGSLAPFGAAGLTLPINFLRGIDSVATADSLAPVANHPAYKPTAAVAQVFDIRAFTPSSVVYTTPPFASAFQGAAILPGQVPAGLPITTLGAGGKWYVFGVGTTGSAIQARALTSTVITNPPFPQVAFFRLSGTGRWVFLGKVDAVPGTNPTIFDQGANRFWTYTSPAVSPAVAAADRIRAVGMTTAGDGLATGTCVKGTNC